jgi:hypothetical protein
VRAQDYQRVLGHAHAVRLMAREVYQRGELDDAIAAAETADAVGSVLDPTLYRDRERKLGEDIATLCMVRLLARLGRADASPVAGDPVAFAAAAEGERKGPAASGGEHA